MSDSDNFDPTRMIPSDLGRPASTGPKPRLIPTPPGVPAAVPAPIRKPRPRGGNPKDLDGSLASICSLLGGRTHGVNILIILIRSCGTINPEAARFADLYDSKSGLLRRLMTPSVLEDLCTEAGIPWPRLVGWAFEAAATTGQHLAAMKAALALPSVVDKTIKFAKQKDGYRDRDFLYRSTGFLPQPGGISIINNLAANAQARNIASDGEMFTPFERDIVEITEVMSDKKPSLPATAVAEEVPDVLSPNDE